MAEPLIAKVNARGTVWTSYYIDGMAAVDGRGGSKILAYKMEAFGSTKMNYRTIDAIVVRPKDGKPGNGWEIVLYGEPMPEPFPTKNEAQRAAEDLLDNERDRHGWLVQNTGRPF